MVLRQLCKLFIRVRFSYPPPFIVAQLNWQSNSFIRKRLGARFPPSLPDYGSLAQRIEHLATNQAVGSLNLSRPSRTCCLISNYCDPQDEKWCDIHGWQSLNRKAASNAITVPVGKRVEGTWYECLVKQASSESISTIITAGGCRAIHPCSSMVEHPTDNRKTQVRFFSWVPNLSQVFRQHKVLQKPWTGFDSLARGQLF